MEDTDTALLEEIIGCDSYKEIKIDKPKVIKNT